MESRGYRNNNPGNIKQAARIFPGEVSQSRDSTFKEFKNMERGYEAVFLLLQVYLNNGYNTIEKIIYRYCPPPDDTEAYIRNVVVAADKSRNEIISANDWKTLTEIVAEISRVENGVDPSYVKIAAGRELAKTWLKRQKILLYGLIILLVLLFLAFVVVMYQNRALFLS